MACCFVCVAVVLLCIACGGVTSCSCNTSTVWDALAALHRSTNGASWLQSGMWLQPGSSVCDWYGVVACSILELGSNNLTGTLPAELSLLPLTSFVVLNFSGNGLSGTIPPQIGLLSHVMSCDFAHNRLQGTLPPELASWGQLVSIEMQHNNLSGTLPASYANWTFVSAVELFDNSISGTLPPEYAAWTALKTFRLNRNQLTGTLPPEYAAWRNLERLRMNTNMLTGSLPASYSSWIAILNFVVFDNGLSGTLPPEYAMWSVVVEVRVDANQLNGTLPPEYDAWRALTEFDKNKNQLLGTLPPGYAAWSALKVLNVESNQLTGSLPHEYSAWHAAARLTLSRNRLSGTIPAAYGALRSELLLLHDNMLSGTVPTLRVSHILTLHNNRHLIGTLPSAMGHALFVVLCNTSVCGAYPPLWAAGLTRVVCAQIDATISRVLLAAELLSASLYVIPHCPTPQPHTSMSAPTPDSTRSVLNTMTSSIGGIGAALTGSAAQHLSVRAAVYASRVGGCRDGETAAFFTDEFNVGTLVVDNPTRLSISGPLPLTSGTVVGNLLLLVVVPLLSAGCVLASHRTCRAVAVFDVVSWSATTLLLVWGFVQVPTAAASVSMAVEAARVASTTGGVVCVVGCTQCGGAMALAVVCWLRVRSCGGRVKSVTHRRMRKLGAVRKFLFRRRSVWDSQTLSAQRIAVVHRSWSCNNIAAAVVRWVTHVLQAASLLLLRGCHYPHSWVIVYDIVGALLSGALVGVASTPHVSCRAVQAAAWAIVGVACVQAAVAVVVRPRSTVADCAFDAAMCIWTAVVALLAALGVEEGSEESAIAQGAVALLYGLPAVALRCHRTWSAAQRRREGIGKLSTPVRHGRPQSSERSLREVGILTPLDFSCASTISRQEALRWLVAHACRSADVLEEAMVR